MAVLVTSPTVRFYFNYRHLAAPPRTGGLGPKPASRAAANGTVIR
jgi:hypothetical protein